MSAHEPTEAEILAAQRLLEKLRQDFQSGRIQVPVLAPYQPPSRLETDRRLEGLKALLAPLIAEEVDKAIKRQPTPLAMRDAASPRGLFPVMWDEIKKHRGWYVVAFLLGGLPVGLATVWTAITRETVPEWLAERGLPRLSTLVIGWVAIALIIALVIVIRSYFSVRAKEKKGGPKPPLPRTSVRCRVRTWIE